MSTFNFTETMKGKLGVSGMPDDILRLSPKHLSISGNLNKLFNSTRYNTKSGDVRCRVNIAYDTYNQAIKVSADPMGFTAGISESGSVSAHLPSAFHKSGLPVGDYKLVSGETNVFQLAR